MTKNKSTKHINYCLNSWIVVYSIQYMANAISAAIFNCGLFWRQRHSQEEQCTVPKSEKCDPGAIVDVGILT